METKGQICRAPWDPVKWTMIFKSSTSMDFRNPGQLEGCSGVAWATMRHHPGLTTPPPLLNKTSQTELSPQGMSPILHNPPSMLVVEGLVFANSLVLHSFNKLPFSRKMYHPQFYILSS